MSFRGFAWAAALIVVAAFAYSVYAPEAAERTAPAAGAYARKLHDFLPAALTQSAPAPAQAAAKAPVAH